MSLDNRNNENEYQGQNGNDITENQDRTAQELQQQPHSTQGNATQPPFDHPAYTSYQEWMAHEDARESRRGRKAEKKKKHSRKPIWIAGSVVAACALLAGGIAIGSTMTGAPKGNTSVAAAVLSDLPTVNISTPSATGSTSAPGLAGEEIYTKVSPSVVSVQAVNISTGEGGTGSGVIMSADGYIITNNHVVVDEKTGKPLDKIMIYMSDGTNLPAEIKGLDARTDLAILKVSESGKQLTPAEFGDSNRLQPGEEVYAIGSPGGLDLANTITGGHISALNRDITVDDRVMSLIQTDAAINPGNSGGALINKYGQVIGITSVKLGISYYEGLGFAIPMDTVKPIVDELIQNGYIAGRPQIGISGENISEHQEAAYGIPQGVRVRMVDSRSNAAAAGIQVNDIITGINGKVITGMEEINEVKDGMKAGEKITLKVYRMSTGKSFDVTFALNDQHDLEGDDPAVQQAVPEQGFNGNPFSFFFGR